MPPRAQRSGVVLGGATTGQNGQSAPRTKSAPPRIAGLAGMGAAGYLWLLVLVEAAVLAYMRYLFRDHHGG